MIARQHHAAALHLRGNIGIHFHVIAEGPGRRGNTIERHDQVEARRELPYHLPLRQILARKDTIAMNAAGPDIRCER